MKVKEEIFSPMHFLQLALNTTNYHWKKVMWRRTSFYKNVGELSPHLRSMFQNVVFCLGEIFPTPYSNESSFCYFRHLELTDKHQLSCLLGFFRCCVWWFFLLYLHLCTMVLILHYKYSLCTPPFMYRSIMYSEIMSRYPNAVSVSILIQWK